MQQTKPLALSVQKGVYENDTPSNKWIPGSWHDQTLKTSATCHWMLISMYLHTVLLSLMFVLHPTCHQAPSETNMLSQRGGRQCQYHGRLRDHPLPPEGFSGNPVVFSICFGWYDITSLFDLPALLMLLCLIILQGAATEIRTWCHAGFYWVNCWSSRKGPSDWSKQTLA